MDICEVSRLGYTEIGVHAYSPSWEDLQSLYFSYAFPCVPIFDCCLAHIHSFPSLIGLHGKKILPVPLMLVLTMLLPLCNSILVYMIRPKICISLSANILRLWYSAMRKASPDFLHLFHSYFQNEYT